MAWQTPKTNWATGDIPVADDFNRIEGNVQELQNTKETPAGAQAKANTAEANAKAYTDAHEQKAAPHSGHETPAGAQAKAEAAAGAVQADLDAHLADNAVHVAKNGTLQVGLNAEKVGGKTPNDFQSSAKVYGQVYYTDAIGASAEITKSIALGGSYKNGLIVISSGRSYASGIVIFVRTDRLKSVGYDVNGYWRRRDWNASEYFVEDDDFGSVTGIGNCQITDAYISGTNLVIKFKNIKTGTASLNCKVSWEVW